MKTYEALDYIKMDNFVTSCVTVSFSGALLHVVSQSVNILLRVYVFRLDT